MKTLLYSVIFLLLGILLGWVGHCTYQPKEVVSEGDIVRIDTIVKVVNVEVPKPIIRYRYLTDTLIQLVNNEILVEVYSKDTINMVQTNVYHDSIVDPDYKLDYEIETLGELLKFTPRLDIYQRTITQTNIKLTRPKWMVGGAFSSNANFKVGLGYKGWTTEVEFKNKLNQVWLGKQFNF